MGAQVKLLKLEVVASKVCLFVMVNTPTAPSTPPAKRSRWADIVDSDCEDNADIGNGSIQPVPQRRRLDVLESDSECMNAVGSGASRVAEPPLMFAPTPSPERGWTSMQDMFNVGGGAVLPAACRIYDFVPVILFVQSALVPTTDPIST